MKNADHLMHLKIVFGLIRWGESEKRKNADETILTTQFMKIVGNPNSRKKKKDGWDCPTSISFREWRVLFLPEHS